MRGLMRSGSSKSDTEVKKNEDWKKDKAVFAFHRPFADFLGVNNFYDSKD